MPGRHVRVAALLGPDEADEDDGLRGEAFVGDTEADLPLAMLRVKGGRPNHEPCRGLQLLVLPGVDGVRGCRCRRMAVPEDERASLVSAEPDSARMVAFVFVGMVFGLILGCVGRRGNRRARRDRRRRIAGVRGRAGRL